MKPYVWDSEPQCTPSGKRSFKQGKKQGSLNLFTSGYGAPHPALTPAATSHSVAVEKPTEQRCGGCPPSGRRGQYINYESTATREFPSSGVRRVPVSPRVETPKGLRPCRDAVAAQQSLQVVNITNSYKDPRQIVTPRSGLRCSHPTNTAEMKDIMEYRVTPQQLRGQTLQVPVGVSLTEEARHGSIHYSSLEKFTQAVRDHCHQRSKGVTQFYVSLCRNLVGQSTPSTPRVAAPSSWSLETPPDVHTLTLLRCRDQLVALTSIPVSLKDLASLMWNVSDRKRHDEEPVTEQDLEKVNVRYTDFANAFAENSDSRRLTAIKIV